MKGICLTLLALFAYHSYGQFGCEFPPVYYHNSIFTNAKGDTLNGLDSAGLFHGIHLFSDNPHNLYSDTNTYRIGKFENGIPVGDWMDHCGDGSFSMGQFSVRSGTRSDGQGGWITENLGINAKIGIWKYFDPDGNLANIVKYENNAFKNGWENKTYQADSFGNFVLIKYEYWKRYHTTLEKRKIETYSITGTLLSSTISSFWSDKSKDYYENGKIQEKKKCVKILGINLNRYINKEYSMDGKLINTLKSKCRTRIINPRFK